LPTNWVFLTWPCAYGSSAPAENFAKNCIRNFLRLANALCTSEPKARNVGRKETIGRPRAKSLDLPAAEIDPLKRSFKLPLNARWNHFRNVRRLRISSIANLRDVQSFIGLHAFAGRQSATQLLKLWQSLRLGGNPSENKAST
jgi:hypothetical protein